MKLTISFFLCTVFLVAGTITISSGVDSVYWAASAPAGAACGSVSGVAVTIPATGPVISGTEYISCSASLASLPVGDPINYLIDIDAGTDQILLNGTLEVYSLNQVQLIASNLALQNSADPHVFNLTSYSRRTGGVTIHLIGSGSEQTGVDFKLTMSTMAVPEPGGFTLSATSGLILVATIARFHRRRRAR